MPTDKARWSAIVLAVVFTAATATPTATARDAEGAFEPTIEDIELRDQLIADQESLLNTYRCRFEIDAHIVPGGCADG